MRTNQGPSVGILIIIIVNIKIRIVFRDSKSYLAFVLLLGSTGAISFVKTWRENYLCQNHSRSLINWEEIELSEHVRKQKKGKEVQVVDPDVFLRLACSTINASTNQTYFYYLKVINYR